MSPEQVQGQGIEAPSDQYSLGVVAYEMLSGQVPFQADSTLALMYKVAHDPPPPIRQVRPDLPAPVEKVLGRTLAKESASRYPTVSAFVKALGRALAGKRAEAAAPLAAAVVTPKPTPGQREAATVLTGKEKGAAGAAAAKRAPPPAPRPATKTKPARRQVPWWILLLAALAVLLCVLAAVLALRGRDGKVTPTAIVIVVTPGPAEEQVTSIVETPVPLPSLTMSPSATVAPTNTATDTAVPTETVEKEPTDEPPTIAPTATNTAQPLPTSTPTEEAATATARPTPSPIPTATSRPTETTPTETSTRRAATATELAPTNVAPTATEESPNLSAPILMSPGDGQTFAHNDQIVLEWQPVGQLPQDGYYEVIVEYTPAQDPQTTWTDETPWVKTPNWTLSEHAYLPGLSADGLFRWSVRVMRKTGENAQGRPNGTALSPASTARTLTWQAPPQAGGGNGGGGAPTSPPP
jgi:serine/threonine-protein kinase